MNQDFELPAEFDAEYIANVTLSYEYTEKSIKETQDLSNQTNAQLGLLIGFNFTYMRFFLSNLPDNSLVFDSLPCNSCLVLKILAYLASGASIFCCFIGLYRQVEYGIIPPNILLAQCNEISTIGLKLGILKLWNQKLQQFIVLTRQKKELFNRSIFFWGISISFVALNYAIDFFLRANLP